MRPAEHRRDTRTGLTAANFEKSALAIKNNTCTQFDFPHRQHHLSPKSHSYGNPPPCGRCAGLHGAGPVGRHHQQRTGILPANGA